VERNKIVGFIFISVYSSNVFLIGMSLIYQTGDSTKKNIVGQIKNGFPDLENSV
jgi:hypothetical protein